MKPLHFNVCLLVVLGLIWQLIPKPDEGAKEYDLFLFYDMEMAPQWYAYMTKIRLEMILMSYMLVILSRGDFVLKVFFVTEVIKLADFWLTYHTTWFNLGTLPITMNLVQIFVLAVVILKEIFHDRANN